MNKLISIMLCSPISVDQCTMTNFGSIHTFNDGFTVAPYEDLTVLSQYIKDPSYDCNFIARVRMEVHVGIHVYA